jgi:lipoate-protein ligase A
MNERIKELNLQAMSIVMNGNDPDGDIEQMYIPSEFTKKFAELIVRECMEWCDAHSTIDGTAQQIRDSIKKDFGVE